MLTKFIQCFIESTVGLSRSALFKNKRYESKITTRRMKRMDLKSGLKLDLDILKAQVITCRAMTPAAKGMAGMILFKVENNITLDSTEQRFYEELPYFLKKSS